MVAHPGEPRVAYWITRDPEEDSEDSGMTEDIDTTDYDPPGVVEQRVESYSPRQRNLWIGGVCLAGTLIGGGFVAMVKILSES